MYSIISSRAHGGRTRQAKLGFRREVGEENDSNKLSGCTLAAACDTLAKKKRNKQEINMRKMIKAS